MMKNINWKKYAGAAMAAAMIPALVAPIATEAASFGLHTGYNIKMLVDGKEVNNFEGKTLRLVNVNDGSKYYTTVFESNFGKFWVEGNATYEIYDITGKGLGSDAHKDLEPKGKIKVDKNGGTTVAKLDYSAEAKAEAEAKAKAEAEAKAEAKAKAATVAIASGYNILLSENGKLKNNLLNTKEFELVGTKNGYVYKLNNKGYTWLAPNQTYEIYDITNGERVLKGQINVGNTTSSVATLNYETVEETVKVSAADFGLKDSSKAYDEINGKPVYDSFDGVKINKPDTALIFAGQKLPVVNNISAHAPASVQFDLKDKKVTNFSGYIGLDANRNTGLIRIDVIVDGVELDTRYQKPDQNATYLNLEIPENAETLEFKITGVYAVAGENQNQDAMFVLGDGVFTQQVKTIK